MLTGYRAMVLSTSPFPVWSSRILSRSMANEVDVLYSCVEFLLVDCDTLYVVFSLGSQLS